MLNMLLLGLSVGLAEESTEPLKRSADVSVYRGMWALNGWAITNIAAGVPLSLASEDPYSRAFHQMNAGWNVVNLALASGSLILDKPAEPKRLAKIFWINAGLDVAYVAAGLAMAHHGRENHDPKLEGWGNSIALQGGFLFGFDAVMGWRMQSYIK